MDDLDGLHGIDLEPVGVGENVLVDFDLLAESVSVLLQVVESLVALGNLGVLLLGAFAAFLLAEFHDVLGLLSQLGHLVLDAAKVPLVLREHCSS